MLKQRLMTGIVLIVAFLCLLFYTTAEVFCLLTGLITLAAAWEWTRLMGMKSKSRRIFYLIFISAALIGALLISVPLMLIFALVFWLLMIPLVLYYPRAAFWKKSVLNQGLMGFFVLVPSWLAINFLRSVEQGQYLLLFFVLICAADSGAYFSGKLFGKTLLAPRVSPGKTREGLYGGLLAATLVTLLPLLYFGVPYHLWIYTFLLSWLTILFSVLGDLFESMLKRSENLKDSGKLLPGHGGLLDRIDSITAAAPVFALGAILVSKIS